MYAVALMVSFGAKGTFWLMQQWEALGLRDLHGK
jgi:hypothetical protein